jgi:hypothetical protein
VPAGVLATSWQRIVKITACEDGVAAGPAVIELPIVRSRAAPELVFIDTVGCGFYLLTFPGEVIFGDLARDLVREDGAVLCRRSALRLVPVLGDGKEPDGWAAI